MLIQAYDARRRRELGELWRVMAHAQHAPQNPDAALPPQPAAPADIDDDRDPGFDPVALVRNARED